MVRIARRPYSEKISNMWPHRWSKVPRYQPNELENYIRKVLIYYPKNLRALKLITAETSARLAEMSEDNGDYDPDQEIAVLETLYMQVLTKYKRSYLKHQNIDITYEDPYTYKPSRLETLRIYQSEKDNRSIPHVLRWSLKLSKEVKHLEIDASVVCYIDILKSIRYISTLESLYIDNFSPMSLAVLKALEKAVRASKATLTTISLLGVFKVNPIKLFRLFAGLPKLRTVNLEGEFPAKFDVRQIPYKMFKERDIRFNIRLRYFKGEVKFATKESLGIAPVDFLGLNCQKLSRHYLPVWDFLLEEHEELQEKSQRILLLNFPLVETNKQWRISKLLRACKDVKTLDIYLVRGKYWTGNEFTNIKYLKNLKHAFITFDNTKVTYDNSWNASIIAYNGLSRNLAFCASTLQSISLHIKGQISIKDGIALLFKSCANTLIHFTLKFSHYNYTEGNNMKGIYTCLQELKQLISLKVIYQGFYSTLGYFSPHVNKMPFTCVTLKEIALMAPQIEINKLNLDFRHLINLQKMQLSVMSLEDKSIFFKKKIMIPNSVTHIKLDFISFSEKGWYKLLAQLNNMPNLEILMLKARYLIDQNPNEVKKKIWINDLKTLMKGHRSLKCIVYRYGWDLETVNVFTEDAVCCSDEEIDKFFVRGEFEIPTKRLQRRYKVNKEIVEEMVVSKDLVEMNTGITGFFKNIFSNVRSRYFTSNE